MYDVIQDSRDSSKPNIKELNKILSSYIDDVHLLEKRKRSSTPHVVTITFDKSEIEKLESTYISEINYWKSNLEDKKTHFGSKCTHRIPTNQS